MATGELREVLAGSRDLEPVAERVVPVALGVATWLLLLLVGGVVLSIDSPSFLSILLVAVTGVLFTPIYRLRPWQPGVTGRFLSAVRRRRLALVLTGALFVLVRLPVVSEVLAPLGGLLLLPLRAVPQVFYDVAVFYDARVGEPAGQLLFEIARLYAELLWLYALAAGVLALYPTGDD